MGYRTTMVSEHIYMKMPEWFTEKYDCFNFNTEKEDINLPFSTKFEIKTYGSYSDLFPDIQKCLVELDFQGEFDLVLMHEDGNIAKVEITKEKIKILEPIEFREVKELTLYG